MGCTNKQCGLAGVPAELTAITARHPCYSREAQHTFARMHLPVAPACNISCNYCNRKFDCVNESRPGVTSEVLTPELARDKFVCVKKCIDNLSVVGIAGPGDALANWSAVKQSIELIRQESDDSIFCLSTNGLMLPHYAEEILDLGIKHVTVTTNCLDPEIGSQIYHHVNYQGKYYTGLAAAAILINNQLQGMERLAAGGVLVKVNIVMIPGVNDRHIPEVVKKVKKLGALMTNIMPLIPASGSAFENMPQTSMKDINALRDLCQEDLFQMRHCQQCRADAVGLLTEDQSRNFRMTQPDTAGGEVAGDILLQIAVTSKYKRLVDLHYGHAEEFHIYKTNGNQSFYVETRPTKKYCHDPADCDASEAVKLEVIKTIADCDAVLTMRIGYDAQKHLLSHGIQIVESCNSVEEGLKHAFQQLTINKAV